MPSNRPPRHLGGLFLTNCARAARRRGFCDCATMLGDQDTSVHERWARDADVQELLAYMLAQPFADHTQIDVAPLLEDMGSFRIPDRWPPDRAPPDRAALRSRSGSSDAPSPPPCNLTQNGVSEWRWGRWWRQGSDGGRWWRRARGRAPWMRVSRRAATCSSFSAAEGKTGAQPAR